MQSTSNGVPGDGLDLLSTVRKNITIHCGHILFLVGVRYCTLLSYTYCNQTLEMRQLVYWTSSAQTRK